MAGCEEFWPAGGPLNWTGGEYVCPPSSDRANNTTSQGASIGPAGWHAHVERRTLSAPFVPGTTLISGRPRPIVGPVGLMATFAGPKVRPPSVDVATSTLSRLLSSTWAEPNTT